jgi:hypothetical protein
VVEVEAPTAAVAAEVSTVAGVGASTAAVEGGSIARVVADIVEVVPSGPRGLSAEEVTAAARLADQRQATTERTGIRTADSVRRAA